MPLFEYRCTDCDHTFELLMRADTTLECPACHGAHLEKQWSVFAAVSAPGNGQAQQMSAPGPCGTCGSPDGPGSRRVN
jgi:putative FmdB family regulatory protein